MSSEEYIKLNLSFVKGFNSPLEEKMKFCKLALQFREGKWYGYWSYWKHKNFIKNIVS